MNKINDKKTLINLLLNSSSIVQLNISKEEYDNYHIGQIIVLGKIEGKILKGNIVSIECSPSEIFRHLTTELTYAINVKILANIQINIQ